MKKRIISLMIVMALVFCTLPLAKLEPVYALSNASALTPITYKTGTYTALTNLKLYTTSAATKSTGVRLAKGKSAWVSAVSGGYGKVTVNKTTGWIDLSYAYNTANSVDIPARLNMLRKKFPDGMYWNRQTANVNNADGYTNKPCASGHFDKRDNYFDGTCQCHGFALKLGYDLFGIHASYWTRHYDISKVVVGDLIRYRSRHTVMVTGVFDDYFTVADCNWGYTCNITWDHRMSKDFFSFYKNDSYDGIYHCQINNTTKKVVLTTTLSVPVNSTAMLVQSDDMAYYAVGVTSNGKTTYTFNAPTGTYKELRITADGCDNYVQKSFVLGKSVLPSKVTLKMYGDLNGDGKVNTTDSTLLIKYLAGYDVKINTSTADVNSDGKVNGKDLTKLRQYLAGWGTVLGSDDDDDYYYWY